MSYLYDSGKCTIRKSFKYLDNGTSEMQTPSWRSTHLVSIIAREIACFGVLLASLFILTFDARAEAGTKTGKRAASTAIEYKLGPQDEIRVRVLEWRPSTDEIFEWTALNANYIIGPRFKLSLPLIGQVSVEGLSLEQLGAFLGKKLEERMGLAVAPDVSVEVIKYRPFYVVGHVNTPGEYSYRPGIDVLQAISLSGGFFRIEGATTMRLDRDIAVSQGERALLIRERDTMIARRARLEAELRGANQISFPKELIRRERGAAMARLMQQENLIFETRKKAYKTKLTVLSELHKFLEKEVISLIAQTKTQDRQLALIKEEKASIDALAAKKLARLNRILDVKRDLATFEVEKLRTQAALSKTRQDISRNQIAIVELENQRESDLRTELQQTDNRIEQIARRMETLQKLLYEAQVIAPGRIADQSQDLEIRTRYTVIRRIDGNAVELRATETTVLRPGDTLKVELLLPAIGDTVSPNRSGGDPAATARARNQHAISE